MKYYIAFDTKEMPGKIVAVTVEIKKEVVRDMKLKMPINLPDDPLYNKLQQFVLSNMKPARK